MHTNRRNRPHMATLALTAAALCTGCISQPRITSDYIGIGDLPRRAPAARLDVPPFTDASELPLKSTKAGATTPYRVGPLDELVVVVWGREDLGSQVPIGLSGELRGSGVREDGTLVMPFLGPMNVSGKGIEEIRTDIQSRYSSLIENPQIEVKLHACASRKVEVSGEIGQPGQYFLCEDMITLGDVIGAADGPTANTDLIRGVLTRDGHPYHLDYDRATRGESPVADIVMQDGDRVFFPQLDERVVYVFGEVGRQGIFSIPAEGMTLLGALARARGIDTVGAKHEGIYLIRQQSGRPVAYELTMSELLQAPEIPLANGDRLFVAMRPLERWDRWWRKALPFTTVRTNVEVVPE